MPVDGLSRLSFRECEVLDLVVRGKGRREIADALNLSVKTADEHVQHAMEKLGVHTRAELISYIRGLRVTS